MFVVVAVLAATAGPGSDGGPSDAHLALGYDTAPEYARNSGNLGATVGRFANRIGVMALASQSMRGIATSRPVLRQVLTPEGVS